MNRRPMQNIVDEEIYSKDIHSNVFHQTTCVH